VGISNRRRFQSTRATTECSGRATLADAVGDSYLPKLCPTASGKSCRNGRKAVAGYWAGDVAERLPLRERDDLETAVR
jgi:hypothetical protein